LPSSSRALLGESASQRIPAGEAIQLALRAIDSETARLVLGDLTAGTAEDEVVAPASLRLVSVGAGTPLSRGDHAAWIGRS
jgi:hypothetical protein